MSTQSYTEFIREMKKTQEIDMRAIYEILFR